jgi:hypothetical protein
MSNKVGGIVHIKTNGDALYVKGSVSYNLGLPKKEAVIGADGKVHGYKEVPQVAYIKADLTVKDKTDVKTILELDEATVTAELNNGKVIVLRNAWCSTEGEVETEEGKLSVEFQSAEKGEEVR